MSEQSLAGKRAAVTGAGSGIGRASTEMMIAAGARVALIDRDEKTLDEMASTHGDAVVPVPTDLLDHDQCAGLMTRVVDALGGIDIFHANAGLYVGGDLTDASGDEIDRMLQLNVNVVMKNVRDVLPVMVEQGGGDVIVTSSLAGHYPTPWEPVYASGKWATNCFTQVTRRQYYKHGIRVGSVSPGPVDTNLWADQPEEQRREAKQTQAIIDPTDVAEAIFFMLTRPRHVTIRDIIVMPTNFDL